MFYHGKSPPKHHIYPVERIFLSFFSSTKQANPSKVMGEFSGGFVSFRQEIDPEYFTRAFNIGVTGCVRCVREIIPELLGHQVGKLNDRHWWGYM